MRLNPDGALDDSFPRAVVPGYLSIYGMCLDHAGGLFLGGGFGQINGIPRTNLGRLRLSSAPGPMELFSPSHPSSGFCVSFRTLPAHRHVLEFRTSLQQNDWTALPPVIGNGDVITFNDVGASGRQRIYRLPIE